MLKNAQTYIKILRYIWIFFNIMHEKFNEKETT